MIVILFFFSSLHIGIWKQIGKVKRNIAWKRDRFREKASLYQRHGSLLWRFRSPQLLTPTFFLSRWIWSYSVKALRNDKNDFFIGHCHHDYQTDVARCHRLSVAITIISIAVLAAVIFVPIKTMMVLLVYWRIRFRLLCLHVPAYIYVYIYISVIAAIIINR